MRVKTIIDAYNEGRTSWQLFRKNPAQTTGAGIWFDLSMSPGNPLPNYYIGGIASATQMVKTPVLGKIDGGMDCGPDVGSSYKKILHKMLVCTQTNTAVPLPIVLCDYLMCYPFIEQNDGTSPAFTNSVGLPRYVGGAGVQMIAVLQNAQVGGTSFFVTYTNSAGVAGRVSQTVICNSQAVPGTLINTSQAAVTGRGPFLPLQAGDSGVQSIQSVTFTGSDIGLFALVLVKPLLSHQVYDTTAPSEFEAVVQRGGDLPVLQDDAFLGMLVLPSGTLSGSAIFGHIETFWST